MEWASEFLQFSPLDESLYGLLSSPPLEMAPQPLEWSLEENKLFEIALNEVDPTSPLFFEAIASRLPWRSVDEVKAHYEALVYDIEMMESANFAVPDYPPLDVVVPGKKPPKKNSATSEAKTKSGQLRRRGLPWSEDEHQLFLMGLNKYGKGDWRSISRYYVITKTPTQVASHAQKYFRRQNSTTPADRRRPSIHDIHTVNPTVAANFNHPMAPMPMPMPMPSFSPCTMLPTTFHPGYGGPSSYLLDQNAQFMPAAVNPTFPADIFNQASTSNAYNNLPSTSNAYNNLPSTSNAYNNLPSSSYFLPSFGNHQYWG